MKGSNLSDIRLTYSGLITLTIRLLSLITGMIFSVIVTRNISTEDFGLFSIIGSLIAYSLFGHTIISYWIQRHIARSEEVGKTAVISNLIFSFIGLLAYFIAAYFINPNTTNIFPILLASILVPITFITSTLEKINIGFKPHAESYSLILFEIAKIPLIFVLLEWNELGLSGIILAIIFAMLIKLISNFYFAWPKLKNPINFSFLIRWIKLSWLSAYDNLASNIYVLDVVLVSIFIKSTEPIAYFAVAMSLSIIAGHAGVFSIALNPKLIHDAKKDFVKTILRLFALIGIPLFVAVIVFAKPLLFLLNPIYVSAIVIVYIQALRAFTYGMFSIFLNTLSGIERVDTNLNANFIQFRKSNLFFIGTLLYIRSALYLAPLLIWLMLFDHSEYDIINFVIMWSIFPLISEIIITLYAALKVKKSGFLSFEFKHAIKYSIVAVIAGFISYQISNLTIIYERNLFVFLPGFIFALVIGGTIYFVIMYIFDQYCKELINSIFHRMRF